MKPNIKFNVQKLFIALPKGPRSWSSGKFEYLKIWAQKYFRAQFKLTDNFSFGCIALSCLFWVGVGGWKIRFEETTKSDQKFDTGYVNYP